MYSSQLGFRGSAHLQPSTNGMVRKCATTTQRGGGGDASPTVLLGLRTSVKKDIDATAVEPVYDTILQLSGEFLKTAKKQDIKTITSPVNNLEGK